MSEQDVIAKAESPATVESLTADLRTLGVAPGMTLVVHSSLKSLGWVVGGAHAVVLALQAAVTDTGTLVLPSHSTDNSDPADWRNPAVPEAWWQTIRDHMPAYDPRLSVTRAMGAIAECFRRAPDVRRSNHPAVSWCAWGRYARAITQDHRLDSAFGEESPLARVYDLQGRVLLLGVGHDSNSSLHLSEYRAGWPGKARMQQGAAVMVGEHRQWVRFEDLRLDPSDFPEIGWDFIKSGHVKTGAVACAKCQLMPQRELVDFGAQWMAARRKMSR